MNIKELNLEQLDSQELINIEAGGFFNDLGAAAHNAWIEIEYNARRFAHYMSSSTHTASPHGL